MFDAVAHARVAHDSTAQPDCTARLHSPPRLHTSGLYDGAAHGSTARSGLHDETAWALGIGWHADMWFG